MDSRTKHVSEGMLDTYRDLLTQARAERARKAGQQHRAADSPDAEPPEVKGA